MSNEVNTTYFSGKQDPCRAIKYHLLLQLKQNQQLQGPGGHLGSRAAVAELRNKILPDFMAQAGIQDLTEKGLRLAVDIPQGEKPIIHLIAGPNVAAQCAQDWLSPAVPWNPQAPAAFFERCAEAARNGAKRMAFGNQMLYVSDRREVFGVMDGDPKATTHFLILATDVFGNVMDKGFTAEHLNAFFETAFQLCEQFGIINQPVRFIANTGTGFQVGPRVHLHVLSSPEGLPSMFPVDYGFSVAESGIIVSPSGSPAHDRIIDLIKERQQIKGFTEEAKSKRKELDQTIFAQLSELLLIL